jgi:hypothetical protein
MADVKDFELFHGIVLTKLVRSDRPIALSLIETNPAKAWAAYKINDEVTIYAKYRTSPRHLVKDKGGFVWTFVFGTDELQQIIKLQQEAPVYLVLICARHKLQGGDTSMHTCLVDPEKLAKLMNVQLKDQQNISVKYLPGKSFRVSGSYSKRDSIIISRSSLDSWQIPGR